MVKHFEINIAVPYTIVTVTIYVIHRVGFDLETNVVDIVVPSSSVTVVNNLYVLSILLWCVCVAESIKVERFVTPDGNLTQGELNLTVNGM